MGEEKIESTLKGNTLRVYWYLLSKKESPTGARETQRALRFSSPALAVYHLDKLADLGLADKTNGEYILTKTVNVGVLKQFVKFGALMVPRHLFYATMFTSLLVFYITQITRIELLSAFGLLVAILAAAITLTISHREESGNRFARGYPASGH
jgi:hypothetical protein